MNLYKAVKFIIGLGTVWLVIYPLLFILLVLFIIFAGATMPSPNQVRLFMIPLSTLLPFLHGITFFLYFGFIAFYFFHLYKNNIASDALRIVMGFGIVFIPFITMPIYYYLYIWLDTPPQWAQSKNPEESKIGGESVVIVFVIIFLVSACILVIATIATVVFLIVGGGPPSPISLFFPIEQQV